MKFLSSRFFLLFVAAILVASPLRAQDPGTENLASVLQAYDIGKDRAPIFAAEESLRKKTPAERAKAEALLLPLLDDPQISFGSRDLICRWLTWMGTPASVPSLEKLASDPKLGNSAVYALINIPGTQSTTALLHFLESSENASRSSAIGALGRRQVEAAVPKLSQIAGDSSADAEAALIALGNIGSSSSLQSLEKTKIAAPMENIRRWALMDGAFRLAKSDAKNGKAPALLIFNAQLNEGPLATQRITAATGLVQIEGVAAFPKLFPLLKESDPDLRLGLAKLIAQTPGTEATKLLAKELPQLDPYLQTLILRALARRNPAEVRDLLQENLKNPDTGARQAAIASLGKIGNTFTISLLLSLLAKSDDANTAATALSEIPGKEASKILLAALTSQQGEARVMLLQILGNRADHEFFPSVVGVTTDSDEAVRAAAFQALVRLVKAEDLSKIIALMPNVKSDRDRKAWGQALLSAARSTTAANAGPAAAALKEALGKAGEDQRKALLLTLVSLNTPSAFEILGSLLESPDMDKRKECIRALSSPDSPESAPLLLKAAEKAQDPSEKILALRGVLDTSRNIRDKKLKAQNYIAAWPLAERQEEKDAIISELSKIDIDEAKKFLKTIQPQAVVALDGDGLKPTDALISSSGISLNDPVLDNWNGQDATASWKFTVKTSGTYIITALQSHEGATDGEYSLTLNEKSFPVKVAPTVNWNDFKSVDVGQMALETGKTYTLTIKPTKFSGYLMNLKNIGLKSK